MLSHQMEDSQGRNGRGINNALWRCHKSDIVLQQILIPEVCLFIPYIKLHLAQHLVVDKEATTEVIYCILGMRQELIREEIYLISGFTEQLTEKRIVTPIAFIANGVGRHKVLEDEAREIPRSHDIGVLHQSSALLKPHLTRGVLLFISVKLGMILIVALTNDKNDIRRVGILQIRRYSELFGSHLFHLLSLFLQSVELKRYKVIGKEGISKTIDRLIHLHPRMQVHILLHITHRLAVEMPNYALLVGDGIIPTKNDEDKSQETKGTRHYDLSFFPFPLYSLNLLLYHLIDDVSKQYKQHPTEFSCEHHLKINVCAQELSRLVSRGLSNEQQH